MQVSRYLFNLSVFLRSTLYFKGRELNNNTGYNSCKKIF